MAKDAGLAKLASRQAGRCNESWCPSKRWSLKANNPRLSSKWRDRHRFSCWVELSWVTICYSPEAGVQMTQEDWCADDSGGLPGASGWGDGKVGPVPHSSSHIPQAPPWSFTKGVRLFKSVLNSMLPVRPVSRLQGCQWIPIKVSPASTHPRTLGFPWIEEKEVGN